MLVIIFFWASHRLFLPSSPPSFRSVTSITSAALNNRHGINTGCRCRSRIPFIPMFSSNRSKEDNGSERICQFFNLKFSKSNFIDFIGQGRKSMCISASPCSVNMEFHDHNSLIRCGRPSTANTLRVRRIFKLMQ